MVDKLISEYGLDPSAKSNEGDTPLHVAAMNGPGCEYVCDASLYFEQYTVY